MRVKDGGAGLSVDQAVESGAELSKAIIELIFEILLQIKDSKTESDERMELLKELKHLRDQLELTEKVHKVIDDASICESRPQTPAEKMYGKSKSAFDLLKIKNNQRKSDVSVDLGF